MSAPPTKTPPEGPVPGGSRPRGRVIALLRLLGSRPPATGSRADPSHRLALDLEGCRQDLARWRRNADSYARELSRLSRERAHLLAWLAALHPASAVVVPSAGAGPHLLRLTAGERQLCWRLPSAELPLFTHVPYAEHPSAPVPGDGHEPVDQGAHIRHHTRLLAIEGAFLAAAAGRRPPSRPDGP
ncbi:hypothetical protein ACFXKY_34070 [Streptomyces canus]|uniref:hypothetical protein n=1 Tax=Streptomyces canus TaxID=58343 RepID=UPI0036B036DF